MTPKSKQAPQYRSDDEKRAIVEAFHTRGDMSSKAFAKEVGISPALLYNWSKRFKIEDAIAEVAPDKPGPKVKDHEERLGIVLAQAAKTPAAPPRALESEFSGVPADVVLEIYLLRDENTRLRKAINALLASGAD